jgi:hypothetical protein
MNFFKSIAKLQELSSLIDMTPVKEDQEIVENFQPNQLCLQVRGEISYLYVHAVPVFVAGGKSGSRLGGNLGTAQ